MGVGCRAPPATPQCKPPRRPNATLRVRGQRATFEEQMSVYASDDPLDFNQAPLVAHMTGLWYNGKYAPEIVQDGGQWYVAGYSRGLHVARFTWQRKTLADIADWRDTWNDYLRKEQLKRQQREEAREDSRTQQ
jgi:hypothetical protein